MQLNKIENRASKRRPPAGRGHNFTDVWLGMEGLLERLDAHGAAHRVELAERDVRIMELQGIVSNQAVVIDQLVSVRETQHAEIAGAVLRVAELEGVIEARADALGELVTTEIGTHRNEVRALVDAVVAQVEENDAGVSRRVEDFVAVSTAALQTIERSITAAGDQAQAMDNRIDQLVVRQGELFTQIETLAATTEALEVADELAVERVIGAEARLEPVAERLAAAVTSVNALQAIIGEVNGCVQTLTGAVAQVDARVDTAVAAAEVLRTSVVDVASGADTRFEQLELLLQEQTARVRDQVADQVDGLRQNVFVLEASSHKWISSLPKNLMIDHRGNLVGVSGQGELVELGRVTGRDGGDGATIQEVLQVDGRLVMVMTDGRRLDAGKIPLAAPPARDENELQTRARALKSRGISGTKIASELGVDRRKVYKWLRGT